MFGVPIEEITKGSPLRQKGKIAELALGYGGAVGALTSMGALAMGLSEDEFRGWYLHGEMQIRISHSFGGMWMKQL